MNNRPHDEDPVQRLSEIDTKTLPADGGERYNRLIFAKSPYLLQHAENPIDWHQWGEEAFARARSEDKPVFLSIGYSTCHWCHVMAHESFEDDEIAKLINRHYIAIKVDREERPDVDNTYMAVCQMMTGSGGWPLNLILALDKKPFFAATYIPRKSRGGMVGLYELLTKVAEMWSSDRERLLRTGDEVGEALLRLEDEGNEGKKILDSEPLNEAYHQFLSTYDRENAGFGTPKFPSPHNLSLLLRLGRRTGQEESRVMALNTLQRIRLGGIFDHIGFGIHRYAVDAGWLVPHFEKMLYDQALAVPAYLEAFQVTGDRFYAQAAREILEYVLRDLKHPEGGFYCGEDADSEGAEGTFYLWTPAQVREVLGEELGTVFCRSYDITEEGNFEGKNIPHLKEDLASLARRVDVPVGSLSDLLAEGRQRLFDAREKRVRPHRDDKVLTGWNGLTIGALARAGAVLEEKRFIEQARSSAHFILSRLRDENGRLLRRFRRGEAAISGFLEDYAFFVWGLIELYLADFDPLHLRTARELTEEMEELFSDGQGRYFDTGKDAETVLVRSRSLQDGAIPSGNSVAAFNLLRLGRLTGRGNLEERGEELLKGWMARVNRYPSAYSQYLIALDYALGTKSEVVLAGEKEDLSTAELLIRLRSRFLPHTLVLLRQPNDQDLAAISDLAEGKEMIQGKAAAYICRDRTCMQPVTEAEELTRILEGVETASGEGK
jgi:uncharacterized protein YyaL (SSP411 family)